MALEVYLTNTPVTLTVALEDSAGNALSVNAVDYRIVNQDNVELVARQALSTYSTGDADATVVVSQSINLIASAASREVRTVEVICTTDSGTVVISRSYGLESLDPLVTPDNSFQSFAMAQLMAMNIPNIAAWDAASEGEQIAALMDAREHIVQLNFSLLNSNVNFSQDQLAYVPEGQYQSSYIARNSLFIFNGNLALLNGTQFTGLPDKFKRALRQAQIVEANAILGGEANESRRGLGIVEDEVGESRQKYRDGVPLRLPVCRRALGYLSYYVTFAKRMGRT